MTVRRLAMILLAVAAVVLGAIVLTGSPTHHDTLLAWGIVALGAATIVAATP